MSKLTISIIQANLHWENIDANLQMFSLKLNELNAKTDLIILPEMFTTGFSMNAENMAEEMEGKTMNWLKRQAAEKQAVISGSFIAKDKGKYYNRLIGCALMEVLNPMTKDIFLRSPKNMKLIHKALKN